MTEPPYISAIQAIGWIAFRDFEGAVRHINQYKSELQKWQVSDFNILLDCLAALENGEEWSSDGWRKESGHTAAQLDIEHVKKTIHLLKKPIAKVRAELIQRQNQDRDVWAEIQKAQETLVTYLRNEIIGLRGIRKSGMGHPEPFPLGPIRDKGFSFLWKNTCIEDWLHLEVRRADILEHWPDEKTETASDEPIKPAPARQCAAEEAVNSWFMNERLPLHKTQPRHPTRDADWKACQDKFKEKARQEIFTKVRRECLKQANISAKQGRYKKNRLENQLTDFRP